jgi:hypothetical protein
VNPEKFKTDAGLRDTFGFEVTSISYMPPPDNRPFVATIESHKYPIFGT